MYPESINENMLFCETLRTLYLELIYISDNIDEYTSTRNYTNNRLDNTDVKQRWEFLISLNSIYLGDIIIISCTNNTKKKIVYVYILSHGLNSLQHVGWKVSGLKHRRR